MAEPFVQNKGQVRIVQDGAGDSFVANTNSGMFESITRIGAGVAEIVVDPEFAITPRDVFTATVEGQAPGAVSVGRIDETTIRTYSIGANGIPADLPFGLVCTTWFVG